MTIKDTLIKLPGKMQKRIIRLSEKLHGDLPEIHTLIICKKPGIENAELFTDFELFLFMNEQKRFRKEENPPFHPGREFKEVNTPPRPDDINALYYRFCTINDDVRDDFRDILRSRLHIFEKREFPAVHIISPEMKKDDPRFYNCLLSYKYEQGYLIFSSLTKPAPTLPGGVLNLALKHLKN